MCFKPNNDYKRIIKKIKKVAELDKNCIFAFAHGSSIESNTHEKSIYEIRIFENNNFKGSVFGFKKMKSDIDFIWITRNLLSSKKYINSYLHFYKNNIPITINIVDYTTFLHELINPKPKALKHVFLVKKLYFIKNPSSGFFHRTRYKKHVNSRDLEFIKEFTSRKRMIRDFFEEDLNCEIFLTTDEQKELFPYFTRFLKGELEHSFPKNRIKLVFPHSMSLKYYYNIENKELRELR